MYPEAAIKLHFPNHELTRSKSLTKLALHSTIALVLSDPSFIGSKSMSKDL
jgi:hypothetical protein